MSSAVVEDVSVHEDEVLICCGVELFLVLIMDLLSLELFNLELVFMLMCHWKVIGWFESRLKDMWIHIFP